MKKAIAHDKNKQSFSFYPKQPSIPEIHDKKIITSSSSINISNNPKKSKLTSNSKPLLPKKPLLQRKPKNPPLNSKSSHPISLTEYDNNSNISINNSLLSFPSTDKLHLQEQLLDLQLQNSRLQNEITILQEKTNSLSQIISLKETDNTLLRTKLNDYLSEFQSEISHLTELNTQYKQYKTQYESITLSFKNLISILIDLIEMFIQFKRETHITHRSTFSNKNDNSMDIYDSFSNIGDEDKRNVIINQIQSIFITKLKHLDKVYMLNLEREIDKIQSWNMCIGSGSGVNNDMNNINTLSNISNILKLNGGNEISNSNSNEFEFSVSKTFYQQSPKFREVGFDKEKKYSNNNISYRSFCDNMRNQFDNSNNNVFSPKSKSNNTSIMKNVNINITSNYNSNNTVRTQEKNYVNILDCSFGDF